MYDRLLGADALCGSGDCVIADYMLSFDDCISCAFIATSSLHLHLLRCRSFLCHGSERD